MPGKREQLTMIAALTAVVLSLTACGSSGTAVAARAPTGGQSTAPSSHSSSATASTPSPTRSPSSSPTAAHPTTRPKPKPATSSSSVKPAAGTSLAPAGKHVFPVVGNVGYAHTHHDYPATDIITACGNTVRAPYSGTILEVTRVDTWKASINAGPTRGGLSFSIKGDDGIRYYGSHLEEINKNIQPGVRVAAGQSIGKIGRTGDAGACHLHFGLSPICEGTGDWWIQRGVIYPWPYLDSWRSGGNKSPVSAVDAWQSVHGCPSKPLVDP